MRCGKISGCFRKDITNIVERRFALFVRCLVRNEPVQMLFQIFTIRPVS